MRSTFSLLPYINRSKIKADGTTAVLVPYNHRREAGGHKHRDLLPTGRLERQEKRDKSRKGKQPLAGNTCV